MGAADTDGRFQTVAVPVRTILPSPVIPGKEVPSEVVPNGTELTATDVEPLRVSAQALLV